MTLGVFDQVSAPQNQMFEPWRAVTASFFLLQVQLFPSLFFSVFCEAPPPLTAQAVSRFFTVDFSEDQERLNRELSVITFWRHFLLECEGQCELL